MKSEKNLEEIINIPNLAQLSPLPLIDTSLMVSIAGGVLYQLGQYHVSELFEKVGIGILAAYGLCAIFDGIQKIRIKKVNFEKTYNVNPKKLTYISREMRESEVKRLTEKINNEYVPQIYNQKELAQRVNYEITEYIKSISNQTINSSSEIRRFSIFKLIFPFSKGACDILSGEVYIYSNSGAFQPFIIGHEFVHRKGYLHELKAQVLTYLALSSSEDPILRQSAYCEELNSHLMVLSGWDKKKRSELVEKSEIREELKKDFIDRKSKPGLYERIVSSVMIPLYTSYMKVTGQSGLKDYDKGFTEFLYTMKSNNLVTNR